MKKSSNFKAPKTLSDEAKAWWKKIVDCFEINDEAAHLLLATAMESFDRMRQAQAVLARDGICVLDRFNQPRQHPATMIERDAKTALLRCLKSLNLDIEPPGPIGRPGGR